MANSLVSKLLRQPQRLNDEPESERNPYGLDHPLAESHPVPRMITAMLPKGGPLSGYTQEDIERLKHPDKDAFLGLSEHDLAKFGLATDALDFIPGAAMAGGALRAGAKGLSKALRRGKPADVGLESDLMYHGTDEDVTGFDARGLGLHVGNPQQASDRLSQTSKYLDHPGGQYREGSNIVPVHAPEGDFLRMDDMLWEDPRDVIEALAGHGDARANKVGRDFLEEIDELDMLDKQVEDFDQFKQQPEVDEVLDNLRRELNYEGFEGIVYKNEGEKGGGITPHGAREREKLFERLDVKERALENLTRTQATDTDEYAELLEEYQELRESIKIIEENFRYGEDSRIIFEPNRLRSPGAEFDPAKADDPDLLSSNLHANALRGAT